MTFHHRIIFIVCLFVLIFSYGNAIASPETGDKYGDWIYVCDEGAGDESSICYISQTLVVGKETKGRILSVNIGYLNEDENPTLIMLFPLGVAVQEKVFIQVDNSKSYQGSIEACLATGCRLKVSLNSELVRLFKKGNTLKVSFQPLGLERIIVNVSLKGISAALNQLK
ncbi:MAG: invasion associated locus B family protein [Alphaproteobacteria bacterium]|nr:invasion associated locus B family protein [Alphaproteobacteria bacterium]